MADFSKEFVERHFEDDQFPWDFEITKIGQELEPNHAYSAICEGYGFVAIYKSKDGKTQLFFDDPNGEDGLEIVDLEQLEERYAQSSLPWQKELGDK